MSLGKRKNGLIAPDMPVAKRDAGSGARWKASLGSRQNETKWPLFGVFEHMAISEHGGFGLVVRCVASRRPWRR